MNEIDDHVKILGICMFAVMIIIIYGTIRCKGAFVDPLTYAPVPPPWDKFLDGWGLSHLLFYAILGYLFPNRLLFITILGISWEFVESMFKDHPFYLSKCNYLESDDTDGWWYGRWQDIVMNTSGIIIGAWIASRSHGRTMSWRL